MVAIIFCICIASLLDILSKDSESKNFDMRIGKKGFDEKSIRRMMQFATLFPEKQIVATLSRQLSWSHFVDVIPLNDDLQREFYLTLAASGRWSVRRLRKEIDGMLFERIAISGKPEEFIKKELSIYLHSERHG